MMQQQSCTFLLGGGNSVANGFRLLSTHLRLRILLATAAETCTDAADNHMMNFLLFFFLHLLPHLREGIVEREKEKRKKNSF